MKEKADKERAEREKIEHVVDVERRERMEGEQVISGIDASTSRFSARVDPKVSFMNRFGIETKSVFEGITMNKRFSSELINQKRFVWIDPEQKKLFWSKTKTKENSPKSISLVDDVRVF